MPVQQTDFVHEEGYTEAIAHWGLDRSLTYLHHGSFGACPLEVLETQQQYRTQMERNPFQFLIQALPGIIDRSRDALAQFLGADSRNLGFVSNATDGVNAVLRSLTFEPGDEILITDHIYNACGNAARYVANRCGGKVTVANVPFPLQHEDEVLEAILAKVTDRTRIALIDHITSPTALIFPIRKIIEALAERGIETLVDGAHAPGMLPLNLEELQPAYYAGNCHKWMCAPKSIGFLYVRPDLQKEIQPSIVSHGPNTPTKNHTPFQDAFDWQGTQDMTAMASLPEAIRFIENLLPGGITQLMDHNRQLTLRGRRILCDALGVAKPCPDEMIGTIACVQLPDDPKLKYDPADVYAPNYHIPVQKEIFERYRIQLPIMPWPHAPHRWVRIAMQVYNSLDQVQYLADSLCEMYDLK